LGIFVVLPIASLGVVLLGAPEEFVFSLIFALFLGLLFVSFFSIWPILSAIYIAKERNKKPSAIEAFKKTFSKILPALWISFLNGLIVSIGFLLFIIPGFIFWKWFFVSIPAFFDEGVKGFKALSRSKELVKGKFLIDKMLGLTVITFLYSAFYDYISKSDTFLTNFISWLISASFSIIISIFVFLLYEKIKKEKERDSIERNQNDLD
jgi:hypothetical protein